MAIISGSRYAGVPFTGIRTRDGVTRKFLHDRRIFTKEDIAANSFEYTVAGEEQLDSLAERFFKDQDLWWLLADVNDLFFALDLRPGDRLLIPDRDVLVDLGIA